MKLNYLRQKFPGIENEYELEPYKVKIDLGAGFTNIPGYIKVDKHPHDGNTNVICNFETQPLPFEDSFVDIIRACHILEHINNLKWFMEECYRILKPNGLMHIVVPCVPAQLAYQDPTHVRVFTDETIKKYFCKDSKTNKWYNLPYLENTNFELVSSWVYGDEVNNLVSDVIIKAIK